MASPQPTLKIASFNVWHGLAGRGTLRFREFETAQRRESRFDLALRTLFDLDPDILFLQELNPLSRRGRELTKVLGGTFKGRIDQSGLKVFSHGLPFNLATGIGLVVRGSVREARSRDDLEPIPSAVRLSGSLGFSGEKLSFHLSEQRYAIFQSVRHESYGRILVANTHLHHGFERFAGLMSLLEAAVLDGRVARAHFNQLLESLDHARDRRLAEIDRLLEVVHRLEGVHDAVVVGGDFNSTADGVAYRALISDGFQDVADSKVAMKTGGDGPTWDPVTNIENHRIQAKYGFEFPLPTFGNPELTNIYQAFDEIPRRIDFLFVKGALARNSLVSVERFGFQDVKSGLAPSDHFGVMASFK